MANDQLTSMDETDSFLEYLLRCGLTAPGASTSPTAGRILARLLVVGAIEAGDDLITQYLVPIPGEQAVFEVRQYQPGNLTPTDVRPGMQAAAALKVALRYARESEEGVEVVSRAPSGLERCVLVRDSTGDFEFRFATPETLIGEPEQCATARSAWEATLANWRQELSGPTQSIPQLRRQDDTPEKATGGVEGGWWTGASPPSSGGASDGPGGDTARAEPAFPETLVAPVTQLVGEAAPSQDAQASGWLADTSPPPAASPLPPTSPPPAAAPLPDTSPPAPLPDTSPPPAAPLPAASPASVARLAADEPLSDPLASAMRDAMSNLVVEVDFGQIEQTIRQVLDEDHQEMVDPLVRRLSARLGESLMRPTTEDIVRAILPLLPQPADLAEAVAADISALLSETLLRRRPGDGGGLDALNLFAGMQQVQVRLDGIQDQLQRSAGLLELMGEHLDGADRRASMAERFATSVDQEMHRLASRIDEQVTELGTPAPPGFDMADGVARLTRKLRQSVAQFDRVLARMDSVYQLAEVTAVSEVVEDDEDEGYDELDDEDEGGGRRGRAQRPTIPRRVEIDAGPPPSASARRSARRPAGGPW